MGLRGVMRRWEVLEGWRWQEQEVAAEESKRSKLPQSVAPQTFASLFKALLKLPPASSPASSPASTPSLTPSPTAAPRRL